MCRYLLTFKTFRIPEKQETGLDSKIQLANTFQQLKQLKRAFAFHFEKNVMMLEGN